MEAEWKASGSTASLWRTDCPGQDNGNLTPATTPRKDIDKLQAFCDLSRLGRVAKKYKVAVVAFHYAGIIDVDDVDDLQKSSLYSIDAKNQHLLVAIPLDQRFRAELQIGTGTNYRMLLMPDGVNTDKFSTLSQAKALGALDLGGASGPP